MSMETVSVQFTRRVPRWIVAAAVVAAFVATDSIGLIPFRAIAGDWTGWSRIAALAVLGYGHYLAVPLGLAAMLFGAQRAPGSLGLNGSVATGMAVGLLCTSLLPVGYALISPFSSSDSLVLDVMRGAVLPGIAEEILYRALLFGFLFRFAGWGFLPAALIGAIFFGGAHLYQAENLGEALMIFALTGSGAVWFSWLYTEWRFNIWVPAAFHVLMNMHWILFDVDETALGPMSTVGLRLAVIVASVIITVVASNRSGGRIVRGRAWLWGSLADRWDGHGSGPLGARPADRAVGDAGTDEAPSAR